MPTDAPKRRWFQFRLRTLLGLIALVAIGLGWIVNSAERQRCAVAALESLGGRIIYEDGYALSDRASDRTWIRKFLGDDYFTSVVTVNLWRTQVTDAGLEHLKGLPRIKYLSLAGTQVTDAGLEHLEGLTQIERLDLTSTKVTDAGLAHLKKLPRLKVLALIDTQITEPGLSELRRALPGCIILGPQAASN